MGGSRRHFFLAAATTSLLCFAGTACTSDDGGKGAEPTSGPIPETTSVPTNDQRPDQSRVHPAQFPGMAPDVNPNVDLRPLRGMFATECTFSHESEDDPIVFPGEEGAAHHHNFFGNTSTDFTSTVDSLLDAADTTCRMKTDTAAYWAPALELGGEFVVPDSSDAYYRVAPGIAPEEIEAYPPGLMMISGDAHAEEEQPTEMVAWACDRSLNIFTAPPECPDGTHLTMRITFQDCWDGENTDSEDHRAHVAYSTSEGCPDTHPVAMPLLTFVVHYPVTGPVEGLGLSPGSLLHGHADFVNTWDQEALEHEIEMCLKRGMVCSSPGGTGGSRPDFPPRGGSEQALADPDPDPADEGDPHDH